MEPEEYNVCVSIFNDILSIPASQMFWDNPADVTHPGISKPFTLHYVRELLERNLYVSRAAFITDLRACFETGTAWGGVRAAVADHLLKELAALVQFYHQPTYPQEFPIAWVLGEFNRTSGKPAHPAIASIPSGQPLGSQLFERPSDPSDLTALIRDIRLMSTRALARPLVELLIETQPEAMIQVEGGVAFNVEIMTEEVRIAVRAKVSELLRKAACGELDPFERPFGSKFEHISVVE
jgi:hypothetical protein